MSTHQNSRFSQWKQRSLHSLMAATCSLMVACGGGGGGGGDDKSSSSASSKSSSQAISSTSSLSSSVRSSTSSSRVSSISSLSSSSILSQASSSRSSAASSSSSSLSLAISDEGAFDPQTVIDDDGNAMVIWRQSNTGVASYSLWVNRYTKSSGWGEPQLLENDAGNVSDANISMEASSGRAAVIWKQLTSATSEDIWVRIYDPVSGWGAINRVEALDKNTGSEPQVAVHSDGRVMAIWAQDELGVGRYSVWANLYTPTNGWGTAGLLETNNIIGGQDGSAKAVFLDNGNVIAVWLSSGNNRVHLWTNTYSGSSWGTASQLVTDTGSNLSLNYPELQKDGANKALLVWGQVDFAGGIFTSSILSKKYDGSWGNTESINAFPDSSLISRAHVATNGNGVAVVTWGRENQSVMANTRGANGVWSQAAALKPANADFIQSIPQTGVDSAADAIVVWSQESNDNSSDDAWYSTFSIAGGGWTAAQLLESDTGIAVDTRVAVNGAGDRVIVWYNVTDFSNRGSEIYARYLNGVNAVEVSAE